MRTRVALSLLAVLALCAALIARQTAPQAPPTFRSAVDLVHLDVSVFDKKRQPVRGLVASEFTLLEDGEVQPIAAFAEVELPTVEIPTAKWMREVTPDVQTNSLEHRRLIVLVYDDLTAGGGANYQSGRAIAYQLIDGLGPSDQMAVVFTMDNRAAQDFTNDHALLRRAIDGRQPGGPPCDYCQLCLLNPLKQAAEQLAEIPNARKALVYISAGTPRFAGSDECAQSLRLLMEDTLAAAQRANVTISAFDPGGLAIRRGSGFSGIDLLQILSNETGGHAVINTNAPEAEVPQFFRANASYYLLGYALKDPKPGGDKYRRLQVRVNRKDVEVVTRNQYYEPKAPPPKPAATDPVAAIDAQLRDVQSRLIQSRDLPLRVTLVPFKSSAPPQAGGPAKAAVVIALGLEEPVVESLDSMGADVLVSAFDPQGNPKGSTRLTATVRLHPGSVASAPYDLLSSMDLAPGRYELRLTARSATRNRTGSVNAYVEVPDFARAPLSMSGVAVAKAPAIASAPREGLPLVLPITPTSARDFYVTDVVRSFFRIYQGEKTPPEAVVLTTSVVDGRGRNVVTSTETLGAERFAAGRGADVTFTLPLSRLGSGPHLLTFEAKAGRRPVARRDVRFSVK